MLSLLSQLMCEHYKMWTTHCVVASLLLFSGGGECGPANPGGPGEERQLVILQTWSQEPAGYNRTAQVAIPPTSAGQKVPVVFHFHGKVLSFSFLSTSEHLTGGGGHGDTHTFGDFLGDSCIIVAPDGYLRRWWAFPQVLNP